MFPAEDFDIPLFCCLNTRAFPDGVEGVCPPTAQMHILLHSLVGFQRVINWGQGEREERSPKTCQRDNGTWAGWDREVGSESWNVPHLVKNQNLYLAEKC